MRTHENETDLYRVLEVDRGASTEEIKRAYRKLALRYHPDRNPGDPGAEDRFKAVNRSYEVLGDETRRRLYDLGMDPRRPAHAGPRAGHPGAPEGPFGPGGGFCGGMGRCGRGTRWRFGRGRFAETLQIDPEEAASGCERELRFRGPRGMLGVRLAIPAGIEDGTFIRLVTDDPHVGEILLEVRVR